MKTRPYHDVSDLRDMLDMLMISRRETGDWSYPHVGEFLWNFFMVLIHLDPCRHIQLWHTGEARLVAYVMLGEDPSLDWQVLPDFAWQGVEEQAFSWSESLLGKLRSDNPSGWGGELACGARQDDTRRIEFLEQHGFKYSGKFAEVNMLRSLEEPIPDLPIPTGCQVRALHPAEVPERAAVEREVWQPWTVGNVSAEDYQKLTRLPGYQPELEIVTLASDGMIASQVTGWIDPLNHIGDQGPVGARQAYRRHGFTRLALLESLRRMKALGMERACISTGVTNIPARNLYESIGFKVENQYLDYLLPASI